MDLKGFQRRFLRARAHGLDPVVLVGQRGLTEEVLEAVRAALLRHELIKLRFIEGKDKARKAEMTAAIAAATGGAVVGAIGHTLILFRPHPEAARRRIHLPERANAPDPAAGTPAEGRRSKPRSPQGKAAAARPASRRKARPRPEDKAGAGAKK